MHPGESRISGHVALGTGCGAPGLSSAQNYIQHYLPADRYKVAGGTWKVVSTENDDLYHRATCPKMLRESAGIVLGFASAADAVEGGYGSCTTCLPQIPVVTYAAGAAIGIPGYMITSQNLINNLADKIQSQSSSRDLRVTRQVIARLQTEFGRGDVRAVAARNQFDSEYLAQTVSALNSLEKAADYKGKSKSTGLSDWKIHLQNARIKAQPPMPRIEMQTQVQSRQRPSNQEQQEIHNAAASAWRGMNRAAAR